MFSLKTFVRNQSSEDLLSALRSSQNELKGGPKYVTPFKVQNINMAIISDYKDEFKPLRKVHSILN